jgi:hypothetical protein
LPHGPELGLYKDKLLFFTQIVGSVKVIGAFVL